jgi:hypothetical protein
MVTPRSEVAPQFSVIINLAVEHGHSVMIRIHHRLDAAVQIDNAQPTMPQSDMLVEVESVRIRPAV